MTQAPELPIHMRRIGFDPVEELASLRGQEGVVEVMTPFNTPAYLVLRYEDVRRVLTDVSVFSNANNKLFPLPDDVSSVTPEDAARIRAGNMALFDPPEHTRLRRALVPVFTAHKMRTLEPRIRGFVNKCLDEFEDAGKPADLVSLYALPIPVLVMCELLGVPFADREKFGESSASMFDERLSFAQRLAGQATVRNYMAELVARAKAEPDDDLLGYLVRGYGDDLSDDELVGLSTLLLTAGHETVVKMISLGVLLLLRHPEQLSLVRDDPAMAGPAIEELMRWLSIAQFIPPRTALVDVEIAGKRIPQGSMVLVSFSAANRDPAFIDNPDVFDISRGSTGHVGFGYGLHHCIGAPLARMEMRIAIPGLLQRFPGLELADPWDTLRFHSGMVLGIESLRLAW